MAINAALLIAMGLTGSLNATQDTRMNMQFAAPQQNVGAPDTTTNLVQTLSLNQDANLVLASSAAQGTKITKSFHSTPAQDVFKWLESNGVNFVVADRDIANREVTLSVLDEPIDNVIQAIGEALDGKFEKKGNLYVFHRGQRAMFGDKWGANNAFNFSQTWGKSPASGVKSDMFKTWQFTPGQGMSAKDKAEFKKAFGDLKGQNFTMDPKVMAELHQSLGQMKGMEGMDPKAMAELRKALGQLKGMEGMDPKAMAELHKSLSGLTAKDGSFFAFGDGKGFEGKFKDMPMMPNMPKMPEMIVDEEATKKFQKEHPGQKVTAYKAKDEKAWKEYQARVKKWGESYGKEMGAWGKTFSENFKGFAPQAGQFKEFKMDGKNFMPPMGTLAPGAKGSFFSLDGTSNITSLLKSLTSDQKDMAKKQGFLHLSDLTGAQRKMLGASGDGNFEFHYKNGKEELTIKN